MQSDRSEDMPSRRQADACTVETAKALQSLRERVIALEADMKNAAERQSRIESRIDEINDIIDSFREMFYEHRNSVHRQNNRILGFVIATLMGVIGSGIVMIIDLMRTIS